MKFEEYEQGVEVLKSEDSLSWIDKVTCWIEKANKYNIYIFQVVLNSQLEIKNYYEAITATIATEFQSTLEKAIEKWNIYIVFECKEAIDWEIKAQIEQDKYAARKLVWDELEEGQIGKEDYLRQRLMCLDIKDKKEEVNASLIQEIKDIDLELYNVLINKDIDVDAKLAIYIGDSVE